MDARYGGPPKVCLGQSLELARRGVEVEILTTGSDRDTEKILGADELKNAGIKVNIFPTSWPHVMRPSRKLSQFLKRKSKSFDLTHIHCVWEFALAAAGNAARENGKPYIVASHGMLDNYAFRTPKYLKKLLLGKLTGSWKLLQGASAIQFATDEEAGDAEFLKLPAEKAIIPNGIALSSPERCQEFETALQQQFPGLKRFRRTVLFFGRFHPKKGLDLLIQGFGQIAGSFPDVAILGVGIADDTSYFASLERQVKRLNLEERVFMTDKFVGDRSRAALNCASIYAHPAYQEGFSTAILDAMSASLPLLVTDRCRMRELERKKAGILVEPSPDGIAGGLAHLLRLPVAELKLQGQNANNWLRDEFTWDSVGSQLIKLYDQLVGNGKGR